MFALPFWSQEYKDAAAASGIEPYKLNQLCRRYEVELKADQMAEDESRLQALKAAIEAGYYKE